LRDALLEFQGEVDQMASDALDTGPSERVAATACDHPFLPLRTGASWSYSGSDGQLTWSVTSAGGSAESASATMEMAAPSVNMTVHWNCSSAGIVSYDFANISALDVGEVATMDIVDSSGTWLPPAGTLAPGSSWSNEYTLVMKLAETGSMGDISAVISESWSVAGEETVSVPAGTFQALRMDGTVTMAISIPMGELPSTTLDIPLGEIPPISINTTYWFAKDVGIVRFTSSSEGFTSQSELTSYSVP
jgi:hypothetical protein